MLHWSIAFTYSIASFSSQACLSVEIKNFFRYASEHYDTHFLVTDLDYRLAGYSIEWMAELLSPSLYYENISLPESINKLVISN